MLPDGVKIHSLSPTLLLQKRLRNEAFAPQPFFCPRCMAFQPHPEVKYSRDISGAALDSPVLSAGRRTPGPAPYCPAGGGSGPAGSPPSRPWWAGGSRGERRSNPRGTVRLSSSRSSSASARGPSSSARRQLERGGQHRIVGQIEDLPGADGCVRENAGPLPVPLFQSPVQHGQQGGLDGVGLVEELLFRQDPASSRCPCAQRRRAVSPAYPCGCRTVVPAEFPPAPAPPPPHSGRASV